jgi:hypothetical protein
VDKCDCQSAGNVTSVSEHGKGSKCQQRIKGLEAENARLTSLFQLAVDLLTDNQLELLAEQSKDLL